MKSKFSYKSKRTIIIAAVITVLLAGTATGVYFFTKGNAQAQAAGDGNTTMQEEQHGEAPIENQSGEQTTTPSNNEQEETNQNQTGEQQTTEEQQENQEQTTNTQATQNNQTTTTATTGEVPNQEYVTEREETIINPWETLTVGWGPTQFAPIVATANLNANKSNLTIAKIADKENVKTGDTITYTISVENTGDKVAKAIIYDNIPEGTVLLDKDNKEDENTKKLTWRVTVEPGKVEKVEFTVRVKSTEGTIKNAAIVNGKTTNETKTGVVNIKTTKISTPSATPLHEMDQITYTLTAKNSGDGEGIVKISDIVPQGTTLVENSIKLENKIYTEAELNEGIDVTLGGKEEKSITFTVTINPFKEEKIIIRNAEAKQDGENIPGTEDEVEKEYVSININKEFVDKENIDKYRPTEVLFGLYANENSNAIITTTTLNEQNNWKGSFTGLDKYDLETKALINYDVREIEVDKNYTPTYDSERKGNNITFNFTNILKYENVITSVTANKIWNDNEGKVGARTSVTFELYKDGEATGITQTASDSLKWKVTFQNLQKYHNDGTPIKYTVVEITKLEHYKEPSYTNIGSVLFVTNTIDYTTFSKDVKITKKWVDPANTEHSDITIDLYQSGNQNVFRTVTLKNGETEYTFTNLPKYDSEGNEYIYTAVEQNVEGYTTSYSDDKLTIINTINQENTVKVEGTKTWVDPQGTEHPTITINLLKNGTIEDVKTLENGTTTYSFENLPKYKTNDDGSYILDENGNVQLNVYTVTENAVEGYTSAQNGTNFTNTINQEKISVSGTKTWIAPQGTEHPTITINLLKDGNKVDFRELTNGTTTYSFDNLEKYDLTDGHEYVYTVTENTVEGYTTTQDGTNFTNTIEQDNSVSVVGTKVWIDPQGTEHQTITITLLKDGEKTDKIVTLENGNTQYSFTGLDKYAPDGHIYEYTVEETPVEGYTTTYSQDHKTIITNTINQEKISVSGTKTWIDPQGTEHPTITINLLRNGVEIDSRELANGTTTYSFDNLDKYAPDGSIYNYTVEEENVEGYTTTQNGTNFTNTINQKKISVSGTKTWIDPQGTEHQTITINLLRNGVEIDSRELANGTTTYSFDNLDKYAPDGSIYNYTVEEENVEGYTTTQNGTNFTNTINQKKISVSGTKTWIAPQGAEHPTITINLLRDSVKVDFRELTNGTTTYLFDNLDKYNLTDGHEYVYTVSEEIVEGYTSAQNGTDFTNTIEQDNTVEVAGTKTWVEPEGTTLVHPEITIDLLKNGQPTDKKVVLENGTTEYKFENLPKYKVDENGEYVLDNNGNVQLNEYSVREKTVRNYDTSYDGYNITNTFNQDIQGTIEITTTTTSQTSVKTPLDVVFVLDVSGSMNDNDKDKKMVNAVNSAITTIMKENPDSRIGVVAYSSKEDNNYSNEADAVKLFELGKYTPKTNGKYLTITDSSYYDYDRRQYYDKDIISTNVNEQSDKSINVYGGTFTQAGIKAGAEMLMSAGTTYTTTVNGKEKTITRTPVMILLSDGDPTYYKTDFKGLTGSRQGSGSDTTENEAYYTIRTADYYKQQITSHYYGTTGTMSKFYTIGLNMSGTLSETILNPTKANLEKCNSEGTEIISHWWGTTTERNVKGKLYDKIKNDGDAGQYSYADKSYTGSMSSEELQSIFNTIINDNSTSTETRDITLEESNARRVNLEGIDTSKEFKLTIESTTYNFETAQSNGYVKGNDTEGYYVDLTNVEKGTSITISYHK